jgi:hypothetical protein
MTIGGFEMEAKHTELPWEANGPRIYSPGKTLITTVAHFRDQDEEKANAEFIVHACNAHDDLVEALGYCKSWFEKHSPTALLLNGKAAEHPMLTCVNVALTKAGAKNDHRNL